MDIYTKLVELRIHQRAQQLALVQQIAQVMDEVFGVGGLQEFHYPALALKEPSPVSAKLLQLGAQLHVLGLQYSELSRRRLTVGPGRNLGLRHIDDVRKAIRRVNRLFHSHTHTA